MSESSRSFQLVQRSPAVELCGRRDIPDILRALEIPPVMQDVEVPGEVDLVVRERVTARPQLARDLLDAELERYRVLASTNTSMMVR